MIKKVLVLFGMFVCLIHSTAWANNTIYSTNGIAISGFDPVAYFTEEDAVRGKPDITHEWMNTTWRFSSEGNRKLFSQNPDKYAPQYGGYCAYAASKGSLAPTEAHAWTIHNNKLYLNYSQIIRNRWNDKRDFYIDRAERKWPTLSGN